MAWQKEEVKHNTNNKRKENQKVKDEGDDSFNNPPNGHGAPGGKHQNKRGSTGHLESNGLPYIIQQYNNTILVQEFI